MSRVHRRARAPRLTFRLVVTMLAAAGLVGVATVAAPPVWATPARVEVTVMAPEGLRLADELRRELEISGFAVTVVATPASAGREVKPDWRERVHALAAAQPGRTVAVRADERQIVLLTPGAGASESVQTSFELQLTPEERSARRRACLTVVEYLRVLAESADRAALKQSVQEDGEGQAHPPRAPIVRQAGAETASSSADPRPRAPVGQEEVATPVFHGLPWTMGVGTTLDLSSSGGRPGGHLQFLWYFPLGTRVSMRARVGWPILGADTHAAELEVRMWTFGAAVGLQYAFSEPPSAWRPFIGLAIGNRIALVESTSTFTAQSRTSITPSAVLGLEAGLRYAVSPRMQVFGELEGTRGWLGPTARDSSPEDELASAIALHLSVGVLFEY